MRAAALDLGSNTLRLLVADWNGSDWEAVHRGLATPRLGRGLTPGGPLSAASRQRAREAAAAFSGRARELGAERIALAATQACRAARDGGEFVESLGRELCLSRARILTGLEEAALSRRGVLSRLTGSGRGAVLVDVGGGSSEVVDLYDEGDPGISLPMGAVSLTEAHVRNDPPGPGEMAALSRAARQGAAPAAGRRAGRLVATAGTAATVASIKLGLVSYQPDRINNLPVSRAELQDMLNRLAALPLAERRAVPGLEPERADVILAGMTILLAMMDALGRDGMYAMDAGLLEGIFLDEVSPRGDGEERHD